MSLGSFFENKTSSFSFILIRYKKFILFHDWLPFRYFRYRIIFFRGCNIKLITCYWYCRIYLTTAVSLFATNKLNLHRNLMLKHISILKFFLSLINYEILGNFDRERGIFLTYEIVSLIS